MPPESWAIISSKRYVKRLERKAGPAKDNPDQVRKELNLAEVRLASDAERLTLKERASAGRRIAYLADQLDAAERLPGARRTLAEREARGREMARAA